MLTRFDSSFIFIAVLAPKPRQNQLTNSALNLAKKGLTARYNYDMILRSSKTEREGDRNAFPKISKQGPVSRPITYQLLRPGY
ncbi:MAG: hypothetical protein ABIG32_02215 [Candidatus Uhrbacteria bacterium]|nr:hypothetical protein [Patescibacteria group bacterium]MBU1906938.1 hypothetical protein [Patescibacteria group bacterium]